MKYYAQDPDKKITPFHTLGELNQYLAENPDSKSINLLFYAKDEHGYWAFKNEFDRNLFYKQHPTAVKANKEDVWKSQKVVWLLSSTCGILNSMRRMEKIDGVTKIWE